MFKLLLCLVLLMSPSVAAHTIFVPVYVPHYVPHEPAHVALPTTEHLDNEEDQQMQMSNLIFLLAIILILGLIIFLFTKLK